MGPALGHGPRPRAPRLDWQLLAQIALCVIPAFTLVGLGRLSLGGQCFFLCLLALLAGLALRGQSLGFLCLIVGTLPAMMLLRNEFYYSGVQIILGAGAFLRFYLCRQELPRVWSNRPLRYLLISAGAYWLLSYFLTGVYHSNLRALELAFTVLCIYLLASHPQRLKTALAGLGISSFAIAFAFLQYGYRPGIEGSEFSLANPISFGIPIAVILLLSLAGNGRWLLLEKRPLWRWMIGLAAGFFLVLSTSRGSWLTALVGLALIFVLESRRRKALLISFVSLALVVTVLLQTERGEIVIGSLDLTFSSEKTLAQSTSGRSDQWLVFARAFPDSPVWGFGPGSGGSIYARYSLEESRERDDVFLAGVALIWHSLFLHVGAETGLIGLACLLLLIGVLFRRGLTHWRMFGDSVPLIGLLGFLVIGLTIAGLDAASGIFLGLGFLAGKVLHQPLFAVAKGGEVIPRAPGGGERAPRPWSRQTT